MLTTFLVSLLALTFSNVSLRVVLGEGGLSMMISFLESTLFTVDICEVSKSNAFSSLLQCISFSTMRHAYLNTYFKY